jgi:hypothetical protein
MSLIKWSEEKGREKELMCPSEEFLEKHVDNGL